MSEQHVPTRSGPAQPNEDLLPRRPRRVWSSVVRSSAFVRKELVEIVRQPRLLGLLVIGPFVLLLLFGAGYATNDYALKAIFVGPPGSVFEGVIDRYEDDTADFIEARGYVHTEAEGVRALRNGEVDVVVVFPDDPVSTVLAGEQARIEVIHDKIDPIQQTAIWVATRLAVQEVNASVLSALASEAQAGMAPAADLIAELDTLAAQLEATGADPVTVGDTGDRTAVVLGELSSLLDGSAVVLGSLDGDPDTVARVDETRSAARELRNASTGVATGDTTVDPAVLAADLRTFSAGFQDALVLDPDVVVRPFDGSTRTVTEQTITPSDYFTPSALALLLQHLGVTFAALSLVRDRSTGLIELLRMGPMSPAEIVAGKSIAYLVLGAVVASLLLLAAIVGLGVPMVGDIAWLAVVVAGVVLASLALGMVLSMMSSTESQAVQMSMLSLLAGLFFSGFVLAIEDLLFPVNLVSWILPVTYGIRAFQDVMFRGLTPSTVDLVGLTALVVVYGTIAVVALRRTLRIS